MSADRPMLSIKEVAERLAISSRGVERLIEAGELAAYKIGHLVRIEPAALQAYLDGALIRPKLDEPRRPKLGQRDRNLLQTWGGA